MPSGDEFVSWELPVLGFEVTEIDFGGRIEIHAHGKRAEDERYAPTTKLAIGGALTYIESDGTTHSLSAEEPWDTLTSLFKLRHRLIESASADNKSNIAFHFDDGSQLLSGPDQNYENWELVGPGNLNLIGFPNRGDPRISGDLGDS
jgi:hypothetical protein